MVSKNIIREIIYKCHTTISEMHSLLDSWSQKEKDTLIKYTINNNPIEMEFYHNLLLSGVEEDIFRYERQIFDNSTKTQRKNILKYLIDFDDETFQQDVDNGYPSHKKGLLETQQEELQEQQGYPTDFRYAINQGWTGGWYDEIQDYIKNKTLTNDWRRTFNDNIKTFSKEILDYIENSVGLNSDVILFRGGHWDVGTRVGDVKTIPLLNSTSFSKDTAYALGIEEEDFNPNRYMITVFAPKGTKGVMVNAPSLSGTFPEHEYLLGKGQKYIVLDVDDDNLTASILLLNE